MAKPIHQEVVFKASPKRVYAVLTKASQFGKVTATSGTKISSKAGGAFSCFDGMIVGRHVELVPDKRIVQAWRVGNWPPGVYSIVRFELKKKGRGTRLVFDHTGFPEGNRDHLKSGWVAKYWTPLKKFLA